MNHEKLKWKTPKTDSLLKEISDLIKQLKNEIVQYSKYENEPYKGSELKMILDTHIDGLKKFSE